MRSRSVIAEPGEASSTELVAAAEAICAELASRDVPDSGAVCMELAERLGMVADSCEAAMSGLVRRVEVTGQMLSWGYSSAAGWLATALCMRLGPARARAVVARQLPRLPEVARRFRSRELAYGYVATICQTVAQLGDDDARAAEAFLLERADAGDSPQALARAGARIHDFIDTRDGTEKPDPDTRRGRKPWFAMPGALDGGAFLSGYADPELKALLHSALDPLAKPTGISDDRTTAQRMADALKTFLSGGGRNWNATIVIDWATLTGANPPGSPDPDPQSGRPGQSTEPSGGTAGQGTARSGGAADGFPGPFPQARLTDGTPIPAWRARQIALNAGISAMILGPRSLPLYMGRQSRLVTPGQHRALQALYDTCADVDCDIPVTSCEIDHLDPWHPDGTTDIDKLVPVCGHLNRFKALHPGQVRAIKATDGRWEYHITGPQGQTRRRHRRQANSQAQAP